MPALQAHFQRATFLTSAGDIAQAPPDEGLEAAFAGRSNAGKSSAINVLCQQRSLARTSKTPGRTRLLNFFALDDQRRLVDLPGYGYAKVAEPIKLQWQRLLEDYLVQRSSLRGLILLMDCRHPLTDFDRQMLDWGAHHRIPVHILLTKADKLKRGAAKASLIQVRKALGQWNGEFSAQLFSALKREGLDQAYEVLAGWLELE